MSDRAVLAGGCFWGMQDLIRKLDGVEARAMIAGAAIARRSIIPTRTRNRSRWTPSPMSRLRGTGPANW